MPYDGEYASKTGHVDFLKNPTVHQFLSQCQYIKPPSLEELREIAQGFSPVPTKPPVRRFIVAGDGSHNQHPIDRMLPSTQVGFLKFGHFCLDAYSQYEPLRHQSPVDPFQVAGLYDRSLQTMFVMPGANVAYKNNPHVQSGFREALFDQLNSPFHNIIELLTHTKAPTPLTLLETLFALHPEGIISLLQCPQCRKMSEHKMAMTFDRNTPQRVCEHCQGTIYASDWLRLHEGLGDLGDSTSMMTRLMNAMEHLMLANFMLQLEHDLTLLSEVTFVVDGPLAVFGEPAKLHARMMSLIYRLNHMLKAKRLPEILIIGFQKTGGLAEHARLIESYIPSNTFRLVDDAYRTKHITGTAPEKTFGLETYYGQDFLYSTPQRHLFNFALPYPTLKTQGQDFVQKKHDSQQYAHLIHEACAFIDYFEMDLYQHALVPVSLAHRCTSIGGHHGSQTLFLFAQQMLNQTKNI